MFLIFFFYSFQTILNLILHRATNYANAWKWIVIGRVPKLCWPITVSPFTAAHRPTLYSKDSATFSAVYTTPTPNAKANADCLVRPTDANSSSADPTSNVIGWPNIRTNPGIRPISIVSVNRNRRPPDPTRKSSATFVILRLKRRISVVISKRGIRTPAKSRNRFPSTDRTTRVTTAKFRNKFKSNFPRIICCKAPAAAIKCKRRPSSSNNPRRNNPVGPCRHCSRFHK